MFKTILIITVLLTDSVSILPYFSYISTFGGIKIRKTNDKNIFPCTHFFVIHRLLSFTIIRYEFYLILFFRNSCALRYYVNFWVWWNCSIRKKIPNLNILWNFFKRLIIYVIIINDLAFLVILCIKYWVAIYLDSF